MSPRVCRTARRIISQEIRFLSCSSLNQKNTRRPCFVITTGNRSVSSTHAEVRFLSLTLQEPNQRGRMGLHCFLFYCKVTVNGTLLKKQYIKWPCIVVGSF